ncbi:MAG: hypothetical protein V1776_03350 [Candidatus Diapherotrites archaeon]
MKKGNPSYNIYVLGNPFIEEDSIPIRLIPKLESAFPFIQFIEIDPAENFPEEKHLFIIDTIRNATNVVVWEDIESIQTSPNYSLHDFDLGMALKLMKKLGKIERVTIFGTPSNGDEEEILSELRNAISNSLPKNESHN